MGTAWLTPDGYARVCNGGLLISDAACSQVCGGGVSCCGTYMWPNPAQPCGTAGTEGMNIRCAPPTSTVVANLPSSSPSGSCGIITKPYYNFRVRCTGGLTATYYNDPTTTVTLTLDGQWRNVLYLCPLPGGVSSATLSAYDPRESIGVYARTGPVPVGGPVYLIPTTQFTNTTGFIATWDFGFQFRSRTFSMPVNPSNDFNTTLNTIYRTQCTQNVQCSLDLGYGGVPCFFSTQTVPANAWSLTNTPCPGTHHLVVNPGTSWYPWVNMTADILVEFETPFGDNCASLGYSGSALAASVPESVRADLQSTDPRVAEAAAAQIKAMGIPCCGG